ncbi:aspartate/glutamate racemase family protein [Georgenia deserti]|uniref:Aspartate/glutamate racemase family protein n=1 Tax=Georgenia deserti TaxID=2093781 RepID=A0ABW4L6L2_9MICO
MTTVGFIHTVADLAGRFEQLVAPAAVRTVHAADPSLLRRAIDVGVDEDLHRRVASHAAHLAACGADAVLVTCSSIGETVTTAAEAAGVPVLRVDAAMAREAVTRARTAGGRIAVLATVSSTLGPTGRLVQAEADRAGGGIIVTPEVVAGAADARSAGDHDDHDRRVRDAVARVAGSADVVVLAQASMAAALEGAEPPVPVLTSPVSGVADLLAVVQQDKPRPR